MPRATSTRHQHFRKNTSSSAVVLAMVWAWLGTRRIFHQLRRCVLMAAFNLLHHRPVTAPPTTSFHPRIEFGMKMSVVFSVIITLGIGSLALGTYFWILKDLPSAEALTTQHQPLTTSILDRNGNVLYRIYDEENRTLVPLKDISPYLREATIAIEDQNFYSHWGFSVRGISRAIQSNIKGENVQGGSTLTQQLVKNRLLSNERTIRRKIRELILAIMVEQRYTKDQILEMYLNSVAYGGPTYGIEAASTTYFDKPAKDLTLGESALLAGLTAAPSAYTPFGPSPELAQFRQAEVLRRMVEDSYVSQQQADEARSETLAFRSDTTDIRAPHFVMYIRKLLADTYGEDIVQTGGLEVRTTLDLGLQDATQHEVTDEVARLNKLRIKNGAALVTNPQTGEILSMVGSVNYFDFANDGQVNVTLRPRQPGSSIKPLTYALAFERGMFPSSTIDDQAITFSTLGSPPYSPKNYDGRCHGRVTLREALGSSYNIPAVKLLAQVGISSLIDKAESMGITTWQDRSRFGLALTLGGGEVLMTDMAKAYGTFATGGYTVDLNPLLEVRNQQGEVLYRNTCALDHTGCSRKRTLEQRVAFAITDVLKDNAARTPAFGPRSVLVIPNQEVAVKTGTTNNLRDNWTIGYTTDRLVAVWVGNNDNKPMSYVASGVTGASPIWNRIIRLVLDDTQPHVFTPPEGLIKVAICSATGTLPCSGCPRVTDEWFTPGTQPLTACRSDQFKPSPSPTTGSRDQILLGESTR